MKSFVATSILLFTGSSLAFGQHYDWKVSLRNGATLEDVHPDSVRNDSLAVSSSDFDVYWFHLDSICSIAYDYNPVLITFTIMGGVIGSTAGLTDSNGGRILIGVATGTAIGFMAGEIMGIHEQMAFADIDPSQRVALLRKTVARWSGRLKIIPGD